MRGCGTFIEGPSANRAHGVPRGCPRLPERPLAAVVTRGAPPGHPPPGPGCLSLRPARICLCPPGNSLPSVVPSVPSGSFLLGPWWEEMNDTGSRVGRWDCRLQTSTGTGARSLGRELQTRAETEQANEGGWLFEQLERLRAKNGRIGTGGMRTRFFKIYFY